MLILDLLQHQRSLDIPSFSPHRHSASLSNVFHYQSVRCGCLSHNSCRERDFGTVDRYSEYPDSSVRPHSEVGVVELEPLGRPRAASRVARPTLRVLCLLLAEA